MTIHFLFGRRESLFGKSEAYKASVRAYLESEGFAQTTDSSVEGTFEDMVFYNPRIAPKQKFLIEAKAENLSLKSKGLAHELVKYFKLWQAEEQGRKFRFMLFAQGVKRPLDWERLFSQTYNLAAVKRWIEWYNSKCVESAGQIINESELQELAKFFSETEVKVGNTVLLELAVSEKEEKSAASITRTATKLFSLVEKRKTPIMERSTLIMNIFPINIPECYYVGSSSASSKKEIYNSLKGKLIPPFIWQKYGNILSFVEFDKKNPLSEFLKGKPIVKKTKKLQIENPTLSSHLVNIHLRRIMWNKGVFRDDDVFYFPMLDKTKDKLLKASRSGKKRWVTKKIVYQKDTKYHRKGEVNFYFHRAVEIRTPTYWATSYIELTPRRYYTHDGETPISGEIRAKIDARFRKPQFDRSKIRIGLTKFWKFLLFESEDFQIQPEKWFDDFKFGNFLTSKVGWSPKVIGQDQTRLWDFEGFV